MSYILEALKKAQAERQLGNAPTVHAPQPVHAAQPGAAASRKPLFIGLGAGALVVLAGALLMWHRAPAPAGVVVAQAGPAGAPVAAPAPPAAPPAAARAAPDTLVVSAPPAPPPRPAPAPASARVPEAPARAAPSAAGRAGTVAPGAADALASAAPGRALATRHAAPAPAAAPAPSPEDNLPYFSQLPEAVQRDLPRVSFGGYMYSANPADRLLLVDKTLRHEGEEVAPGLVLEKLLPKAAVMNYRGVRYRVAY
jgi:general secretion pathway protein B